MGRDPEQRNRLFEDKAPLGLPVELPENPAHRDGGNQGAQAPAVFEDVCVRNLMKRHEHGREKGVHQYGNLKSSKKKQKRKRSEHRLCDPRYA